jgi:hypothetical protein
MSFSNRQRAGVQNKRRTNTMRKRTYTLAVLTLLTAATIATGWATQSAGLLGSQQTEQTIAGSAGAKSRAARESSFAGSEGGEADAGPDSSIASSKGAKGKAGRESSITGSEGDEADVARVSSIIAGPLGERAKSAGRESS